MLTRQWNTHDDDLYQANFPLMELHVQEVDIAETHVSGGTP